MAKLIWDQLGSRSFETGLDRGVLYLANGAAVVWNGLTSIQETLTESTTPHFVDGVKYLDREVLGEFKGKLKAFTYPAEFEDYIGLRPYGHGLFIQDQRSKAFDLTYRTLRGNDILGQEAGYKIHILYNVTAVADEATYESRNGTADAQEFGWSLTTLPEAVAGYRPTSHVVIDSTKVRADVLTALENTLYGTASANATLPSLVDVISMVSALAVIVITDNGDGTWTATGPSSHISMLNATTFQIAGVNGTFLDADTYTISTTEI